MLLTQRGEEFIQRFANSPPPDNTYHPEPCTTHLNPSSEAVPRGYHRGSYGYSEDQGGFGEDSDEHQRQYTYHVGDDPVSGESGEHYDDGDYDSDDGGGYTDTEKYHGTTGYTPHDENFNVVYSRAGTVPNIQQVLKIMRYYFFII